MHCRMIHYPPAMGLRPRPFDDYDRLCLRFYRASVARNVAVAMEVGRELAARYGAEPSDADDFYGHGQMLDSCEIR